MLLRLIQPCVLFFPLFFFFCQFPQLRWRFLELALLILSILLLLCSFLLFEKPLWQHNSEMREPQRKEWLARNCAFAFCCNCNLSYQNKWRSFKVVPNKLQDFVCCFLLFYSTTQQMHKQKTEETMSSIVLANASMPLDEGKKNANTHCVLVWKRRMEERKKETNQNKTVGRCTTINNVCWRGVLQFGSIYLHVSHMLL